MLFTTDSMKRYNFWIRLVRSLCVVAGLTALTFTGCTEVDDSLGSDYIPDRQQLRIGFRSLKPCFEARLYRTDSIRTSNIEVAMMGSTISDTFGVRTAGFYSQYTWGYCPDSTDGFGYRPIFDSIMLGFVVNRYEGDTTRVRRYEVYEVIDDAFLSDTEEHLDTLFYGNFDMEPYLSAEPAFTFDFPNQEKGIYTTSTAVTMTPTATGRDLVERLMLLKGAYADNDMSGFFDAADWIRNFKGIYVKPAAAAASREENSLYELDITQSGLVLYGRNRNQTDPTLIQDTTTALYYFCDTEVDAGGISINTFSHDYAQSLLAGLKFEESDSERTPVENCYVEGMAGVVTELTITPSFFEQLEQILAEEKDAAGNPYRSLAINQAAFAVYDAEVENYDWENLAPSDAMIWRMDNAIDRLGIYTSYKKLTGIADYSYAYEESYGTTLNFGGYYNRSRGGYTMDIALYVQSLWNRYLEDKEAVLSDPSSRTIYLAPEAYDVNTFQTMSGQGTSGGGNTSPLRLELTYTLTK